MTSFQRPRQPANDPDELIQAEKGDFVGIDAIGGVEGEQSSSGVDGGFEETREFGDEELSAGDRHHPTA